MWNDCDEMFASAPHGLGDLFTSIWVCRGESSRRLRCGCCTWAINPDVAAFAGNLTVAPLWVSFGANAPEVAVWVDLSWWRDSTKDWNCPLRNERTNLLQRFGRAATNFSRSSAKKKIENHPRHRLNHQPARCIRYEKVRCTITHSMCKLRQTFTWGMGWLSIFGRWLLYDRIGDRGFLVRQIW